MIVAKKKKSKALLAEESRPVYLTKRVIERAIRKGKKKILEDALKTQGYLVQVMDGWVVKTDAQGKVIERISKVRVVKKRKINLD